ncbi:MAG TPA: hypothetical protein VKU62_01150, partial [Thermoanaerobaculia bacterium]|nr:hypothetical protein [Thermoanaerobaculia bacterium]
MNTNRKADLQRKLAVAPVPKPPAGLAERIKTEIPKELRFDVNRERVQFARSLRLSLAVAASVIVIVSSVFLALRIVETADQQPEAKPATIAIPRRIAPPAAAPPVVSAPALNEAPKNLALKKVKRQKAPAAALADEQRSRDAIAPK